MDCVRKGLGTQDSPFPAIVRELVNRLLKTPRLSIDRIKEEIGELPGASALRKDDLENGDLANALVFRLHLKNMRSVNTKEPHEKPSPGTIFVDVKLKEVNLENQSSFEKDINNVRGVVEWDGIQGERDYLVRIVNSGHTFRIRDEISKISTVKSCTISTINVAYSGIVDKFEADDFFNINPRKKNKEIKEDQT